jgi:hypothetical protein
MTDFPVALYFLAGIVALTLSPCAALIAFRLRRSARQPAPGFDPKLAAKLAGLEREKNELVTQWENSMVATARMLDRIRLLERLLVDERRQRLAETEEILALREKVRQQAERLALAAHAIRTTHTAIKRRPGLLRLLRNAPNEKPAWAFASGGSSK